MKQYKKQMLNDRSMEDIMRMIENNEFTEIIDNYKGFVADASDTAIGRKHRIKDRRRRVMNRSSN